MANHSSFGGESPWNLDPSDLQDWYQENVQDGSSDFDRKCKAAMKSIVDFLHDYKKIDVKEILKAGSMGKGTYYKESSDLDCVVIANNIGILSTSANTGRYRRGVLKRRLTRLTQDIQQAPFIVSAEKQNNLHLKVVVENDDGDKVDVDILLSADNLSYGKQQLYEAMIAMRAENQRWVYHACLAPLQRKFVKSRPDNVKALIRMLKYWKAEYLHRWDDRLLNSYLLELLAIYAWEQAGSPEEFELSQGLKSVLCILAHRLRDLRHYWTVESRGNYDADTAERAIANIRIRLYRQKPILLDPANPTNNIFGNFMKNIDKVSTIAQETLRTPLLSNVCVPGNWPQ